MKVWTCTNFKGRYPVGTCAIIIAETVEQARDLLQAELDRAGLKQDRYMQPIPLDYLDEVELIQSRAEILLDGNY